MHIIPLRAALPDIGLTKDESPSSGYYMVAYHGLGKVQALLEKLQSDPQIFSELELAGPAHSEIVRSFALAYR
jgi:hypothetical protein